MAASVLSAWAVNCCHHAVTAAWLRSARRGPGGARVLLPVVGGFGVGLAGFGCGLDAAAVEFLAGSAGGQPLGFVVAFPPGAGLVGGLEPVGEPGFPGGGGAGEGGVLVAAGGLVELGLPRELGGGLPVLVDLAAHVGRGGFGGLGVGVDVALELGAAGGADVVLGGVQVEGAGGVVPGGRLFRVGLGAGADRGVRVGDVGGLAVEPGVSGAGDPVVAQGSGLAGWHAEPVNYPRLGAGGVLFADGPGALVHGLGGRAGWAFGAGFGELRGPGSRRGPFGEVEVLEAAVQDGGDRPGAGHRAVGDRRDDRGGVVSGELGFADGVVQGGPGRVGAVPGVVVSD